MRFIYGFGILGLAALPFLTVTGCSGDEETEVCDNGTDDDGDGATDCDDTVCATDAACGGDDTDTDVQVEDEDCNDGDDNDGDGDEDCDDSDCTDDEDCATGFTPDFFSVGGGFGYDATADKVVIASVGGEPLAPYVELTFATEAYLQTGDEAEGYCVIGAIYNGATDFDLFTAEVDGDSLGGFQLPDGQFEIITDNCVEAGMDLSVLAAFGVTTLDDVMLAGWGVLVGDMAGDVFDVVGDSQDAEYLAGGGFYGKLFEGSQNAPDGVFNHGYSFGYGMDADHNILNEDGEPLAGNDTPLLLQGEAIQTGTGVPPTGYYQVAPLFFLGLGG